MYTGVKYNNSGATFLLSQDELNDLIRDLNLSKRESEILGSRMQQWNLLRPNTRISCYRQCQNDLTTFFQNKRRSCVLQRR